jgi:hypothetical protein
MISHNYLIKFDLYVVFTKRRFLIKQKGIK